MKKSLLKKIFILPLLTLCSVCATSCDFGGDNDTKKEFEFGETATLNKIQYTVKDAVEYSMLSTPTMLTTKTYAESGAKWIAVSFNAKNSNSIFKMISASDFKLVSGETQYNVDIGTYTYYIDGNGVNSIVGKEKLCYANSSITIDPGFAKEIIAFFKVPEATSMPDSYVSVQWALEEIQMKLNKS